MQGLPPVQKAPKGAAVKKCLPASTLAYELAIAVLRICLTQGRAPIERGSVQAVSPVLAAAYQNAQSTIPTYLGQGRSADGLGLMRPRAGAYPCCTENATLAVQRLEQLGHSAEAVAILLGTTEAELLAAILALPSYEAATAPVVPPAGPVAPPPPKRKEEAKETAPTAKAERLAKERADIEELGLKRQKEENPETESLMSRLDD